MKKLIVIAILLLSVFIATAQMSVTISGLIKDKATKSGLQYVSVVLKTEKDSKPLSGTISTEDGRFSLSNARPGDYLIEFSLVGYITQKQLYYVGSLNEYLDLGTIELVPDVKSLSEVAVIAKQENIAARLDKKTFSLADNINQSGGSVLQAMQNLPGVTVQDGKVQLRGSEKVAVLIDGNQTAMTGFGNQAGLDNIPASAIEKIEIINNPSAKFDANGNAGIINIIYKKNKNEGLNGKIALTSGLGALWKRQENLPGIRPQYQATPKINPSISLNYKKGRLNTFLQADNLYTQTLNKNEFVTRTYSEGDVVRQQLKRNRNTNYLTTKAGLDWSINSQNTLSVSGLFGTEKIIDRGDQPFFNADLSERSRLWQFLEDELKTTVMVNGRFQHKFKQAGHLINFGFSYTFHREDEKYFFDNTTPAYTDRDAFELLSDEHVADLNIDYVKPLKYGRIETGLKLRKRDIPTYMLFIPGTNSALNADAGGWATYKEIIPALYGTYIFETRRIEAEAGIRLEYVNLHYNVNPNHPTYKSDGYSYSRPFPNVRIAYKINSGNKISLFYNARVDRPNEVDIRIFPKYDDAEIIKVGNPGLRPQYTNSLELGYKTNWTGGYLYTSAYHRFANGTISRIATTVGSSNLIYAIFQNAGKSNTTGLETIWSQDLAKWYSFNFNVNAYRNWIDAFSVFNLYPEAHEFAAADDEIYSGSIKWNNTIRLPKKLDIQLSAIYLAPDIIPQGKVDSRFSLDAGVKKTFNKGRSELTLSATDLLNTMVTPKEIVGNNFSYTVKDYYETQVFRLGYSYKF